MIIHPLKILSLLKLKALNELKKQSEQIGSLHIINFMKRQKWWLIAIENIC